MERLGDIPNEKARAGPLRKDARHWKRRFISQESGWGDPGLTIFHLLIMHFCVLGSGSVGVMPIAISTAFTVLLLLSGIYLLQRNERILTDTL